MERALPLRLWPGLCTGLRYPGMIFFEEATLMMELPKRHATFLYGQPARTH